jgi:hypothetical protein
MVAWVGFGRNEARVLVEGRVEGLLDAALDLAEGRSGAPGTLVVPDYQLDVRRLAIERAYAECGARQIAARRLAAFQPLKEVVAVPADTAPVPQ